jgi:hypothetical protein
MANQRYFYCETSEEESKLRVARHENGFVSISLERSPDGEYIYIHLNDEDINLLVEDLTSILEDKINSN